MRAARSCSATRVRSALSAGCGAGFPHLGDAPGKVFGEQPDDDAQDVMDETHPALDPAHRARELDRIAASSLAAAARLGASSAWATTCSTSSNSPGNRAARHSGSRLKVVWLSGNTSEQSSRRAGSCARRCRGLPAHPPLIRAALKPCIAPRLGPNVFLAGEPRLYRSCNRPFVASPRGPTPFRSRGVETTTRLPRHQAVTMWTRPADRDRPTDRVDKAWTSAPHLPTPSPHSALSRPHPHRFCNNHS